VGADPQTVLPSEIAQLHAAIDGAARATEIMLADQPPEPEHQELGRQLAALRERVALAHQRNEGRQALRAELATLLCFARTLQADAEKWSASLAQRADELERQKASARAEQERLVLAREDLVKRREALQSKILQTAARMAQQTRGECRRTLPVFTLGDGLTVCSVSVAYPRRGLRLAGHWLVTLGRSHDVLVRRE
jgi:chromosome segregation ATPase